MRRMRSLALAAIAACLPQGDLGAQGRSTLVVITGASGGAAFATAFGAMARAMVDSARTRFALADSSIWYLAEDSTKDAARMRGRSSKATVERVLGSIARTAGANDRLVIVVIGHGTATGEEVRLNLPGPDMTPEDFSRVLGPMPGTVAFVNTASASGDFIKALSGRNRIVITATKSAREQSQTVFPVHFVHALTTGAGDTDKDGRVSLLEAFAWARKEVERHFEKEGLLPTEHPLLDDDADGVGTPVAEARKTDGRRAGTFFLEPEGGRAIAADPRAAPLLAERRELEARIESLRGQRGSMTDDAYQRALEPLMVKLAETTRALRALEARKP